jgi:uncharacterized protein GlcG (DUF336 family)
MTQPSSLSVDQRCIATDAAARAVSAAVAHAQAMGLRINVAVTDAAGVLVAFLRMPGAYLHSIDIAIDKAYTAASFGFPTSGWKNAVAGDPTLRDGLNARPRLVMFGGGLPVREGGVLIGGIGVSGGSADQDEACAAAGLAALGLP